MRWPTSLDKKEVWDNDVGSAQMFNIATDEITDYITKLKFTPTNNI
jgi:hypothetical protein